MKFGIISKLFIGVLVLGFTSVATPVSAINTSSTGDHQLVADGWKGQRSYKYWNNNYHSYGNHYRPYYYNSYNRGYYDNWYRPYYYNSYYTPYYYYNSYPYGGSGLYFSIGL